jgi:hypothetical protein
MSIVGVSPHPTAPVPDRQPAAGAARPAEGQVRRSDNSAQLTAQAIGSGKGHGAAPGGTGAPKLNATGRGRIVNIVV